MLQAVCISSISDSDFITLSSCIIGATSLISLLENFSAIFNLNLSSLVCTSDVDLLWVFLFRKIASASEMSSVNFPSNSSSQKTVLIPEVF